jgi:phenylacetate-coenzyme A ligase PaaK-like adenylate-forming protein
MLPESWVKKMHVKRVRKLFEWAKENSAFYRKNYLEAGVLDLEIKTIEDIKKLPIVDKSMMRDCDLDLILTRSVSEKLVVVKTSGTNGIPFDVYASKKEHFTSYVRTFMALSRYNPFTKFGLIGVFEQKEKIEKQSFLYYLQQKFRLFRRETFPIYTPHNQLINQLKEQQINLLASSPSCLHVLTDELAKSEEKLSIKNVVVSGETLFDNARDAIRQYFQAKITNVYGCMELPSMAWTKPDGELYNYALNSVYLEYVNPIQIEGEMYGELVITNLINKTMPFIRYKVGDYVKLQPSYKKMGTVKGRAEDVFVLGNGKKIYMVLLFAFAKIEGILQYRFIQKKNGNIHMEVVRNSDSDKKELEKNIISTWENYFEGQELFVEFRNDLPINPKTGKFKRLEIEK